MRFRVGEIVEVAVNPDEPDLCPLRIGDEVEIVAIIP